MLYCTVRQAYQALPQQQQHDICHDDASSMPHMHHIAFILHPVNYKPESYTHLEPIYCSVKTQFELVTSKVSCTMNMLAHI